MRDPKRIDEVLELIRQIWKEKPDLRLTQLILNARDKYDPYYMEDDVLVKRLREVYQTPRPYSPESAKGVKQIFEVAEQQWPKR
jgi:uncharacterized protein YihD (DUF1040 family)